MYVTIFQLQMFLTSIIIREVVYIDIDSSYEQLNSDILRSSKYNIARRQTLAFYFAHLSGITL